MSSAFSMKSTSSSRSGKITKSSIQSTTSCSRSMKTAASDSSPSKYTNTNGINPLTCRVDSTFSGRVYPPPSQMSVSPRSNFVSQRNAKTVDSSQSETVSKKFNTTTPTKASSSLGSVKSFGTIPTNVRSGTTVNPQCIKSSVAASDVSRSTNDHRANSHLSTRELSLYGRTHVNGDMSTLTSSSPRKSPTTTSTTRALPTTLSIKSKETVSSSPVKEIFGGRGMEMSLPSHFKNDDIPSNFQLSCLSDCPTIVEVSPDGKTVTHKKEAIAQNEKEEREELANGGIKVTKTKTYRAVREVNTVTRTRRVVGSKEKTTSSDARSAITVN